MRSIIGDKLSLKDWLASGAGAGHITPASGTWGSLFGFGLGLLVFNSVGVWPLIILTIFYGAAAFWAVHEIEKNSPHHDPSWIVADEILAIWLILIFLPLMTPLWLITSFIAFRILDIFKPWPISKIDREYHGARGVMMDDIVAALIVIIISWGAYVGLAL